jgi:hypothetical protein
MLLVTIITGIIAIIAAYSAGITSTWIGTGSVTGIVLFLAIAALPQCHFLFDSGVGAFVIVAMWAIYTTFVHRLLSNARRRTPISAGHRSVIAWQFGKNRLALAWEVAA